MFNIGFGAIAIAMAELFNKSQETRRINKSNIIYDDGDSIFIEKKKRKEKRFPYEEEIIPENLKISGCEYDDDL